MGVPELEEYRRQIQEVIAETNTLTAGLSEAQFNWRPPSGGWSIEECLAHLTIVGNVQLRELERAIEDGHARGLKGEGPFSYPARERFVVDMSGPPVREPQSAPARFQPLHGQPVTAVVPSFLHLQSQVLLLLDRAEGLDLVRVKVSTPFARFLKFSLGTSFAQLAAHQRRHLEQARRVAEKAPHLPSLAGRH